MLHKMQFIFFQAIDNDEYETNKNWEVEMLQEIFLYGLDIIRKRIDILGGIDLTKVAQDTKDKSHLSL